MRHLWTLFAGKGAGALLALALAGTAHAERIKNPVAEFAGIDKITGRIITFDAYIGETVQFGALQVTPRVCYSAPDTEEPKTDSFVEEDEITLDRKIRRIFTGWMFAESPGLNAVEHPIYDVYVKSCAMTYPGGEPALRPKPKAPSGAPKVSSAPQSPATNGGEGTPSAATPAPTPKAPAPAPKTPAPSAKTE